MTDEEIRKVSDQRYLQVVKANELISRATFSLTAQQNKIVCYLISKISPDDDKLKFYDFSVIDYCNVAGINYKHGGNYDEIKKSIKELRDKSLWLKLPNGKTTLISWIQKAVIEERNGTIKIRLDEDLQPYLLHLVSRGNYTQYELINVLRLKSRYAIRLYELIRCYTYGHCNKITFELEELKELLDAKNYDLWGNFKNRVLNSAIKEINQFTDKNCYYTTITRPHSKKVEAVQFIVNNKPQTERMVLQVEMEREMNKPLLEQECLFDDTIDLLE